MITWHYSVGVCCHDDRSATRTLRCAWTHLVVRPVKRLEWPTVMVSVVTRWVDLGPVLPVIITSWVDLSCYTSNYNQVSWSLSRWVDLGPVLPVFITRWVDLCPGELISVPFCLSVTVPGACQCWFCQWLVCGPVIMHAGDEHCTSFLCCWRIIASPRVWMNI